MLIYIPARVVDGIEDNSQTFQFNVEQSHVRTNAAGNVQDDWGLQRELI